MFDPAAFGAAVGAQIKAGIAQSLQPWIERVAALEQRIASIPAGKDGRDGIDGKDGAPGEPGKPGEKGADGVPGERGQDGKDGMPGPKGEDGKPGEKGADGKDGRDGRDGKDGRDGEPGKDAADIQPIADIDPAKSYPRGTWAQHKGGLWVSRAATEGMSGWDCVVSGIDGITAELGKDARTLTVRIATSGGKSLELSASLPTMIYRGIWREGEQYAQGDTVTRGGSAWVLTAEAQKAKPGEDGSGWQLAVKKGTDGRDGLKGEKGERGGEGRAGRDLTQMTLDGKRY